VEFILLVLAVIFAAFSVVLIATAALSLSLRSLRI